MLEIATAQSPGLPSFRVWDYESELNEAPRTIRVEGTGKRKITGKKSIRGARIRGKAAPGRSKASQTAASPRYRDTTRPNQPVPARTQSVKTRRIAEAPAVKKQSGKQALDVRQAFTALAAEMEQSVTQIVNQNGRSVLGTVVSSDGLIVSKNSLVDRDGKCIFSDGQQWPYRVIATDQQRDLCLIEVKRRPTVPVRFDDQPEAAHSTVPGTISVSIGRNRSVAAWGVVTLPSYDFQIGQSNGDLKFGALLSAFPASSVGPVKGVEVLRVSPRTLAEQMGLLVGDQIMQLNGRKIQSRNQINTIIGGLRTGDTITASVDRNGLTKRVRYKASSASNQSMHDRWGGGPYSKRRFGFGPTLVHDSVLNPENCGGPLVGLQGQLFGINIARSMRVASLAIGSDDVLNFVVSNQPNAKLRLASLEDAKLKLAQTAAPSK